MKKLSLLCALPLALLVACAPEAEEGNGAVTTRSHTLEAFDAIHSQLRIPIDIEVGAEAQSVEVVLDESLQDAVTLAIHHNTLNIGTTRPFVPSENTRVVIRMPQLAALSAQGSGDISLTGRQTARTFLLEHTGEGNLTACTDFTELTVRHHTAASLDLCVPAGGATLEALNLRSLGAGQVQWEGNAVAADVSIEGASSITLIGQAESLNVRAWGEASLDAEAFPVEALTLETTSSGLSRVHATGSATIRIGATGDVELSGAPAELDVNREGPGELIEVP